MKKFILIIICLCGSVIFFSQQSVAGPVVMSPSVFASTFEQTGSWSQTITSGTINSTNWPNSSFNSRTSTATGIIIGSPVVTGSPSDHYVTVDYTFEPGIQDAYYNGTEYVEYTSGTGTDIFHYVSGTFDSTACYIVVQD